MCRLLDRSENWRYRQRVTSLERSKGQLITLTIHSFKPSVPNQWLLLLAGLLWTVVGGLLCFRAYSWLETWHTVWAIADGALGVVLAITVHYYGFSAVARRNIARISRLPERVCVFAFTAWRGYAMIAVMMTIGIILRNSPFPKEYLALIYTAMGGALLLASSQFYLSFWRISVERCERSAP